MNKIITLGNYSDVLLESLAKDWDADSIEKVKSSHLSECLHKNINEGTDGFIIVTNDIVNAKRYFENNFNNVDVMLYDVVSNKSVFREAGEQPKPQPTANTTANTQTKQTKVVQAQVIPINFNFPLNRDLAVIQNLLQNVHGPFIGLYKTNDKEARFPDGEKLLFKAFIADTLESKFNKKLSTDYQLVNILGCEINNMTSFIQSCIPSNWTFDKNYQYKNNDQFKNDRLNAVNIFIEIYKDFLDKRKNFDLELKESELDKRNKILSKDTLGIFKRICSPNVAEFIYKKPDTKAPTPKSQKFSNENNDWVKDLRKRLVGDTFENAKKTALENDALSNVINNAVNKHKEKKNHQDFSDEKALQSAANSNNFEKLIICHPKFEELAKIILA